jgi:hypothetical protein
VFSLKGFSRRVCESFLINLFGIVSDSLRSAVGQKLVFGLVLSSLFPLLIALKEKKRIYFQVSYLKHKQKK